jgi:hypothetical protein
MTARFILSGAAAYVQLSSLKSWLAGPAIALRMFPLCVAIQQRNGTAMTRKT